jgi:GDP-L-fucose synthase
MKVLVTGGSGFLGTRLSISKPDWIYVSSRECDLTDQKAIKELLNDLKPSAILHLAARVGGIKDNTENQADFYYLNTMINVNILNEAHNANINRVLSSLSTCAFPDKVSNYPFTESDFFSGPPAKTNFSYGMTKRMLHVASMSYQKQYNRNYSTFCPSNIYGPGDHFDNENSHFVASLVSKVANAKDGDTISFWGTGKPMRQQLYVDDLCDIMPKLLNEHNTDCPLIVAPDENLTIKKMVDTLVEYSGKDLKVTFNGKLDGQYRKDGSNEKLRDILPNCEFTSFYSGIIETYKWYLENNE